MHVDKHYRAAVIKKILKKLYFIDFTLHIQPDILSLAGRLNRQDRLYGKQLY